MKEKESRTFGQVALALTLVLAITALGIGIVALNEAGGQGVESMGVHPSGTTHFGSVDLSGNLTVDGTSTLSGGQSFTGTADFDSSLNVDGAVTMNSTADIDGNVSSGTGSFTVTDSVNITGAVDADSTLNVDGAVTMNSTADIDGNVSSGTGSFTVTDSVNITGAVDLSSTLQYGANNLYPVGYASSGQQLVYGSSTVTGTESVNHGLTTVTWCMATMGEDPTAGAGEAAHVTVAVAANACTVKVWQDDFVTEATETDVDVHWIVIGTP